MLEKAMASLDAEEKQRTAAAAAKVVTYQILGDLGPRLWRELKESVKSLCARYPDRLTFEIQPQSELVVRGPRSRFLQAAYLADARRVVWQIGEAEGDYRIALNDKNDAVFVDDDMHPYPSVEYVAERLLIGLTS